MLTPKTLKLFLSGTKVLHKPVHLSCLHFSNFSVSNTNNVHYLPPETHVLTNKQVIDLDSGLKSFMNKTYAYTGGGIFSTLAGGMFLSQNPELFQYMHILSGAGFFIAFGGTLGMGMTKYNVKTTYLRDPRSHQTVASYSSENSTGRKISYLAVLTGMTMTVSPLLAMANLEGILMPAMLSSGLVFGGSMLYAKTCKVGALEVWGPTLYGGLFGLIGCSTLGILSHWIFGPNMFSGFAQDVNVYMGIPLFAGLIAYDTHKSIQMYQVQNPDHLGCSVELYLDFINVLVRIIRIMSNNQQRR